MPNARACSIANALTVIGERWSLLALREVFFGVHRFDRIAENTGASRDILAARLRTLVAAGVLDRRQYEQHPPRYEYVLTEAGQALHTVLLTLMDWGDRHVTDGPPPTVWRHGCGATLAPRTVCAACGEPVRTEDMTLVRTRRRADN
ncbi:helix-turn-helix domain-containing protein [Actinophytocola sp.]|uniref:winged helix-turn-helix transcriptional regulator n=1 Tax=Actinophytocola sp. TaxID=1872138 RepID=UPI002D7E76AD|nr:helix-turn-helix domain-containing protein [Actinophytocola sp.]HET9139110.1 helix-turn-helix domain-containing protein [Actinophytocola sp.]HEU5109635.1 helix-turn-helix domain-containing protein [Micromonosporaceae bacterium]